ncbi:Eco57I restriction-modification methylase domain-containing protein [Planktothrix agardhii]|uniref:Eco57I restriction-modification methylase domain-containing protein n=1 Tax=Planktothrix agardhii TaxID=1160 RepID=UPI001D09BA1D|nr:Eco57I restriction-modification methylase domain-containing protein [Planktothrix agardhii]MCB8751199.1 BREX-1 system adenine-specific DNA-methyltransferase PglX [Planktothrix agardhii 1810]
MQVTKTLFQTKILHNAIRNFAFPDDLLKRHEILQSWIETLKMGTLEKVKETSLQGDFLKDIFQDILGYRSVISGEGKTWEIHAEQTISDGGGFADGALGLFTNIEGKLQGKIIAPIELKNAKNDLDRPAPGRKLSAVEQGWQYANYTENCRWVIVSNYRELRLYQLSKTPAYFERFLLTELAEIANFKKLYYLLCRTNFLPKTGQQQSVIDRLLADSDTAQQEITEQLYQDYHNVRINLVNHFRFTGPKNLPNRDNVLIEKAQKTLDRILFLAFCQDRGLLPKNTLNNAHDHKDPYNPRFIWDNYKSVFSWVNKGNEDPPIPGYNGGLFEHDSLLDEQLTVTDPLCTQLKNLTKYDFETEVSVDILGHIFEQSITDLEALKAKTQTQEFNPKSGKRKTQGIFYTPAFITQYIVQVALGGYLKQKEDELRDSLRLGGAPRFQLNITTKTNKKQQKQAEIQFWQTYRDQVLKQTKVCDPACGSGAFLIAAFDYLFQDYQRVNQALSSLVTTPELELERLDTMILTQNLYGVDLSAESVEITKLSLWLKTAEPGKSLTDLDDNIKQGNSIVADPEFSDKPFNWETEFPEVFATGGFDVVIGNPPYVRQELLSPIKPYLKQHYQCYDGVADLYAYFYEKGLNILKPAGKLSYIVTNKWLKAGYGEPLRRFFIENSTFEQIIDFGHAPIFEDADTFPCIISVYKSSPSQAETTELKTSIPAEFNVKLCPVPREKLANINLTQYVHNEGYDVAWSRFTSESWSLERPDVEELMKKIQRVGIPLKDFAGVKPLYGIKTGLNEAFLIDDETKNKIVQADPKSAEIIKPYLRGQDIKRWSPEWQNLWMIYTNSEVDINFYPSVKQHLSQYKDKLEKRASKQVWWQIEASPTYYQKFLDPKLIVQRIAFYPRVAFDNQGLFINDSALIIPSDNYWILGCLNSPANWYLSFRYLPHKKDEALAMDIPYVQNFPIAPLTNIMSVEYESIVQRLIEITISQKTVYQDFLTWLQIQYKVKKITRKLENFADLNFEELIEEVIKQLPKSKSSDPLGVKGLKSIREAYNEYVPDIKTRKQEALNLEKRLSDLVNQAYQLTPEEIELMWKTAPPRMPFYPS